MKHLKLSPADCAYDRRLVRMIGLPAGLIMKAPLQLPPSPKKASKKPSFLGKLHFHRHKTVEYFNVYYRRVQAVQIEQQSLGCTALKLLNAVLLLKSLQFYYLAYQVTDPVVHALHFDALWVVVARSKINLLAFRCALMTAYHNYELFHCMNFHLLSLLQRVLTLQESEFFGATKEENRQFFQKIKRFYLFMVNLFQCFDIVTDILVPYTHIVFALTLYLNPAWLSSHTFIEITLSLLLHAASSLTFFTFFYNFNYVNSVTFSALSSLLMMFFMRMRHVYGILNKLLLPQGAANACTTYAQYRRLYYGNFAFFMSIRKSYCNLFLTTLFVICPNNIVMSLWISLGKVVSGNNLFIAYYLFYQFTFIFVIHLALAYCSTVIHKPVKKLFHLYVGNCKAGRLSTSPDGAAVSVRSQLQLSEDIAALNTKKRYGFTYGNTGIVSMAAFAKYLLLYGKFVIIVTKCITREIL